MFSAFPIPLPCCDNGNRCCVSDLEPCDCGEPILNVDLVADMAAIPPYDGLKQFNVRGWYTVGDGLGGVWIYDATSEAVADGYSIIEPPGGVGRYLKFI